MDRKKSGGFSIFQELSKESTVDIKFNLYCQAILLASHSKATRERNEEKIIQDLEKLETNLLEMEEKISAIDSDLEKVRLYKKTHHNLQEKITSYEKFLTDISEVNLDTYIRSLEENLAYVGLKNFELPNSVEGTGELSKYLKEIDEDLAQIIEMEKIIQPFSQLHTSWLEVKRNVQREEELKNICEKDLKIAEKLVYDGCFRKSVERESLVEK